MNRPVLYIDSLDQAGALLTPMRTRLLREMAEPRTCTEMAGTLGTTPQKVHYHVKILEKAQLITRAGERPARGFTEGIYQAVARSYWLSPRLVRRLGGSASARDQASLTALCGLAEEMLDDVGRLTREADTGVRVPSLSMTAEIELDDPERRDAFLLEVQAAFQKVADRYGARSPPAPSGASVGAPYRLKLSCYRAPAPTT